MNKKELADKIRNATGFSNDEKSALLELVNRTKKYGLVWEDKSEDVHEQLRTHIPVLKEVKEKALIYDPAVEPTVRHSQTAELFTTSEESDLPPKTAQKIPNHIIIESDNLHALVALQYSHAGKIDFIYIDPPYNTGNKDFKYNDTYVDKEDSYRHSKWLSFMHKRLSLAKKLLTEKGVIFVSIDDNEAAQLKICLDEIFGNDSFVSQIIWVSKTGSSDAETLDNITEYILVYVKSEQKVFAKNYSTFDINRYKLKDVHYSERGPFYLDNLDRGGLNYSDSMNFGVRGPGGLMLFPNGRTEFAQDGWTWKWGAEKVQWGIENDFIEIMPSKKKKSGWAIKYKNYLLVDNEGNKVLQSTPIKNLIDDVKTGDGAADLKKIFHNQVFKYSKPTNVIKKVISAYIKRNNFTVLDFFAGSGTTLHAVMELNSEDGGNRQCILVTNNENNICEEVTYERNKRVIQGYTTPKGNRVEGLRKNNLRYFKTELLDREQNLRNFKELTKQSTDLLRIKEDCYEEVSIKSLRPEITRLFKNADIYMMIIYDDRYIDDCIPVIKSLDKKAKVYVFAYGQYPYTDDFEEVLDKIELCAIPDAIYEAYLPVLPPRKGTEPSTNEEPEEENIFGEGE